MSFWDFTLAQGEKTGDVTTVLSQVTAHEIEGFGAILSPNNVTLSDQITWDIHSVPIHGDVTMGDHLAGLIATLTESKSVYYVVQSSFQEAHQHVTRIPLGSLGLVKVATELSLQHPIKVLNLLFFSQMNCVVGLLSAAVLLLPRRGFAAFESALGAITTHTLQKQFQSVAAAQPANGSSIPSHFISRFSNNAIFGMDTQCNLADVTWPM